MFEYFGCASLDGPSQSKGAVKPVYCPSSEARNKWEQVATIRSAPAMGTTGFAQHMSRFLLDPWFEIDEKGCKFNTLIPLGACQRPDQLSDWDAVIALVNCYLTDIKLPKLNTDNPDDNSVVDITGTFSFEQMKRITRLSFEEQADTILLSELIAGFYNDVQQCGECGTPSDGCSKQYWLQTANAGSPGKSSQVIYTLNGGSTWAALDIPSLGGLSGTEMVAFGPYCVVFSKATNSLVWIKFSDLDAGLTSGWSAVTTGFVAAKGPNAAYVKSGTQAFIAADGGYIFEMTSPAAGVTVLTDGSITTQNLNAIDGNADVIVAVGASNVVLKSINGGLSFSLLVGPVLTANLTAVKCITPSTWFVGGNVGGVGSLWYTNDYGISWHQISVGTITTVEDIKFVDELVGYIAVTKGANGYVYRTIDGGTNWFASAPYIQGLPTNIVIKAVAVCGYNEVTAGGWKTAGGDGLLATAK
jgi:photosystem II stability/assembly factor-like uncharacterized protein